MYIRDDISKERKNHRLVTTTLTRGNIDEWKRPCFIPDWLFFFRLTSRLVRNVRALNVLALNLAIARTFGHANSTICEGMLYRYQGQLITVPGKLDEKLGIGREQRNLQVSHPIWPKFASPIESPRNEFHRFPHPPPSPLPHFHPSFQFSQ